MLPAAEAANLIEPGADGIEVPPYGERYAELAVVGDGPGAIEARERQPFSGASGRFLKDVLSELGTDLHKVYWANVYERYGEAPNPDKTAAYGKALLSRLKELPNLKAVLAVSAIAGEALTGTEITNVSEARTHTYSTPEGIPIIVTYHPSALLRSGQRKSKFFRNFQADIKRAIQLLKPQESAEPEEGETRGDIALPDPGRAQRHPDR